MAARILRTYTGQDNRQTSKREVLAWYSYCFASEVYAVVSLSMFLEYLAHNSNLYPRHIRTTRLRERSALFRPYNSLPTE